MKRLSLMMSCILVAAAAAPLGSTSAVQQPSRFKNIKVLTSLSDADINREMQKWTKSLGEQCTYCHETPDYSSDANPKKDIARKMYSMLTKLNEEFLGGKASCVLCHRGSAVPQESQ